MMNELLNLLYGYRDKISTREFDCLVALIEDGTIDSFEELAKYGIENMNEKLKAKEVVMPVCPYCKAMMRPQYFHGYYESFPMWECDCHEIPGAEETHGSYA